MNMKVSLNMSPRLIPNVASLYSDTNRIIMEYIDNSIDSAEEFIPPDLRNQSVDFPNEVIITIHIDGNNFKVGRVIIKDNCKGIPDLSKVIQNVGNSDKKTQFWTNGQFGYGIFSFMACCEQLEITTKYTEVSNNVKITREQFNQDKPEDVVFNIDTVDVPYTYSSGTEVKLSQFPKEKWESLNVQKLKEEIENHFELILKRNNIKITLIDKMKRNYVCSSFNYDKYAGGEFNKELKINYYYKKPGEVKKRLAEYDPPIKIKLKYTKGLNLSRSPIFISKKRRIAEVRDIRAFRSLNKSNIWSHPQITGYIDVGDLLNPTIARNDFKNDNKSRRLFSALIKTENEILDFLKDLNMNETKRDYSKIELQFNNAFGKILLKKIEKSKTLRDGSLVKLSDEPFEDKYLVLTNNERGYKANPPSGASPIKDNPKIGFRNKLVIGSDLVLTAIEPKNHRTNLSIKIDDISEPVIDKNGKMKRSELIDSTVLIYKKHQDFMDRIDKSSRIGEEKISFSLLTYMSSELILHYLDLFFAASLSESHLTRKEQFIYFTELLYKIETYLKDLVGEPLGTLKL